MKKLIITVFSLFMMLSAGCENTLKDSPAIDDLIALVEQYFNWIYEGRILAHSDTDEVNYVTDLLKTLRKDLYAFKDDTSSIPGLKTCIADFKKLMDYPLNEEDRGHFEVLTDRLLSMIYAFQEESGMKFIFYLHQNFGSLDGWETVSIKGDDQEWETAEYGNPAPCGVMSGYSYATSSNHANEDWLVSPKIDLSGLANATLSFEEAINYDYGAAGDNEQIKISTSYTGDGRPQYASWTDLTLTGRSPGSSWDFYKTDEYDLSNYLGQTSVYVALVYTSTSSVGSTWEIDNILIEGTGEEE